MKIVILAAGNSRMYYPLLIDKPKCMYSYNGMIQLERVINDAETIVSDEDIIVVGGYKGKHIKKYIRKKHPKIGYRFNSSFNGPAIHSLRTAVNGISDDVVFMLADESVSLKNLKKICESQKKMAIMCHDSFYYYSVGIMKLRSDVLDLIKDNKYLDMECMKEIYCFANEKEEYDGSFNINSGICLGYITIDLVRRIGNITKVENPVNTYDGDDIDFIHYNPDVEYISDLDKYNQTDEYKNSLIMRLYSDHISDPLKRIIVDLKKRLKHGEKN